MRKDAYLEMYNQEDHHWWFAGRRAIIKKILDTYLPARYVSSILEAGCGTGGNLELLSQYGHLSAIETNDKARELANSRRICEVKNGRLPFDIPYPENFDLICMLDVLEHIEDDMATLRQLRKALNPHGLLLITVPAWMFLWSAHDVVMEHKRRYLKHELLQRVRDSGLQPIYCTYFNTLLFPVISAVRIIGKLAGRQGASDIAMPAKGLNSLLAVLFGGERLILPAVSLPVGVSILLLAENPG